MDCLFMYRCRWNSSICTRLHVTRGTLFKALLTYFFIISPSAAATLAVVYPEVPAPYKQVFEQIIEGIKAKHVGPIVKYPIESPITPEILLSQMGVDQVDMVVTLGRRGLSYNKALNGQYPFVTGALPIKPNGISGVSLIADPLNLFKQLKTLSPDTRNVHVVYTEKSQWLIEKAQQAAQANGLSLISYKASDIREAVSHYQKILKKMAILSPLLNCMTLNIFKLFKIVFTKKRLNLLIKKLKSIVITSEILKFTYMD